MATLATRLNSNGVLQVNGIFDEVTYTSNKTTVNTVYAAELDEVSMQVVYAAGATATTGTTFVMDYPTGTQIGDLAIVAFSTKNNFGSDATATGWTVVNRDTSVSNVKAQISYKVVTDLNQVTFTKSTAASTAPTAEMIVIRTASFSAYAKAVASSVSTPDPAAVASTGAVIQTLHVDNVVGTYTPPSGYTLAGFNLDATGTATVIAYRLTGASASEDAGTWGITGTTSGNWVTYSIAIAGTGLVFPSSRQTSTGKLLVSGSFDEVTGIS
jgi:hypothetical protein